MVPKNHSVANYIQMFFYRKYSYNYIFRFVMSSNNEPTWSICRRAVWMFIQNSKTLADVNDLLNRQEHHDMHIASGKCIILLLVNIYIFLHLSIHIYIQININTLLKFKNLMM